MDNDRERMALEWISKRIEEFLAKGATEVSPHNESVEEFMEETVESKNVEEDAIVQVGGHTYVVAKDGKLIPADSEARFAFKLKAIEGHRLRAYAREHNTSVTAIVREALSPIIITGAESS